MAEMKAMLILFAAMGALFLVLQCEAMAPQGAPAPVAPHINCSMACGERCKLRGERCLHYCGMCCDKCNCVPPGQSGNKELCPCYANWKTTGGRDKCP